jgi:hypothetical protein
VLATVIALGVSGCDENEASDELDATAIAATIAADAQEVLSVSDLIAPPAVSFQVVFAQYDRPGDSSYFVWRQGNGRRRWDDVPITPEGLNIGDFSLEIDFSGGGRFGDPSLDCGWSTRPAGLGPGEAYVMCGPEGWGSSVFRPVSTALMSDVTGEVAPETILGRRASCYSLQPSPSLPRSEGAVVCLDSDSALPLRLEIEELSVKMEAISVSLSDQDLVVPVELQPVPDDPLGTLRVFNGIMPMTTLQLPDLSQFEE